MTETIGTRVAQKRVARGMTQASLAERIGVQSWTVARWETGRQAPRGETLVALADALGVTAEWLVSGRDERAGAGAA